MTDSGSALVPNHPPAEALRWAIYTRKSDDDKKVTEKSIADQLKEARLLADRDGLFVVWSEEESKSAKVPYVRPLFNDLLKKIEKGEVTGILCWHVNRLARNMAEGGLLAHLMAEGKLKEIRTPTSIFKTGDNIIPLVVETGTSTQYSLEVVRNVSRGMRGHFERGGTAYKAPAGYKNRRDPENSRRGIVIKDETRFPLIRRGFDMLLTGAYTVNQVRTTLNETWGYRSRQTKKRGGKPLSLAHAYKLFSDPFYCGFVRYKGEMTKGVHEPMVTPAEFKQVQENLGTRQRRRVQKAKAGPKYAFTGLMRCGYCGQQVTADTRTMTNGKLYISYHCADSRNACTKQGMSHEQLETAFSDEIARIEVHPRMVDTALNNVKRVLQQQYEAAAVDHARHAVDIERLNRKLWRLEEMYAEGLIESEERYRAHLMELRQERAKATVKAEGTLLSFDEACESAHNAAHFTLFARQTFLSGDNDKKREIVRSLATGLVFFGKEKRVAIQIDPILAAIVTYARGLDVTSLPSVSQPEVRAADFAVSAPLELSVIGSETKKNASARAAFFSGGPQENLNEVGYQETSLLERLVELFRTRAFPDVCTDRL